MISTYADYNEIVNRLTLLIRAEYACLEEVYEDIEQREKLAGSLASVQDWLTMEFYVLIMGLLGSGKSSFTNALIGEELLPTGFLPETAVIGELHYGEKKRITLYPKKACAKEGDQPFDLAETTSEEIAKYVSLSADDAINTMDEEEGCAKAINSKFEKMVIYWPLEILKDGVVLVDSPGINDPYCNDHIVNEYLPQADAIVYVMDSCFAYQGMDRRQLTAINEIGFTNIITGYTFYDIVVKHSRSPEKLQKYRNILLDYMAKHSCLGEESVHFLDSMEGLQARMSGDREAFRRSGYEGLEKYLERYLVEKSGTDRIKRCITSILTINRDMLNDCLNSHQENRSEAVKQLIDIQNTLYHISGQYKFDIEF